MNKSIHKNLPHDLISFAESYLNGYGVTLSEVIWKPLTGGGSDRTLYRLSHPKGSLILAVNEDPHSSSAGVNENDSFFYICHHLQAQGIAVPEIYDYRRERGWLMMEDLGDTHLQNEALLLKDDPAELEELYKRVLAILPLIQVKGAHGLDDSRIHNAPYDKTFVRQWESGYFYRSFLKGYCHLDIPEDYLADEFDTLAAKVSSLDGTFFLYRDFQSQNIMIRYKQIHFLDFQGGRRGPLHYDLASLLLDPYVGLSDKLQETLTDYYLKTLSSLIPLDEKQFLSDYPVIALHRNMQILGAFGHLSTVKQRKQFVQYIPTAIKSLKKLLNLAIVAPYENLRKTVENL
jgi:aminoglycoside/choline kinase family phosphotransferase